MFNCRNEDRSAWWPRDVDNSCWARPLANKTGTGSEVSKQSKSSKVHGVFCPHTKRTEAGKVMQWWHMTSIYKVPSLNLALEMDIPRFLCVFHSLKVNVGILIENRPSLFPAISWVTIHSHYIKLPIYKL